MWGPTPRPQPCGPLTEKESQVHIKETKKKGLTQTNFLSHGNGFGGMRNRIANKSRGKVTASSINPNERTKKIQEEAKSLFLFVSTNLTKKRSDNKTREAQINRIICETSPMTPHWVLENKKKIDARAAGVWENPMR